MSLLLTNKLLHLRPIEDKDYAILNEIYSSTRAEELKQVTAWSEEHKRAFLTQQFNAQHDYYQKNYVGANFFVIQKNTIPIGRLYIQENFQEREIRIIDIALLPPWRNQGLGTGILTDILNRANDINRPVTIHVESFNPAMKLYERLGFKKVSETNGVYYLMEYLPTPQKNK